LAVFWETLGLQHLNKRNGSREKTSGEINKVIDYRWKKREE